MDAKPGSKWRQNTVFCGMIFVLLGLVTRMWILGGIYSDKATKMAERQQRRVVKIPARIGNIYATANNRPVLLATSRQAPACFVDPSLVEDNKILDVSVKIGDALGMEPMHIQDVLISRRKKQYAAIKKNPYREITSVQRAAIESIGHRAVGVEYQWAL